MQHFDVAFLANGPCASLLQSLCPASTVYPNRGEAYLVCITLLGYGQVEYGTNRRFCHHPLATIQKRSMHGWSCETEGGAGSRGMWVELFSRNKMFNTVMSVYWACGVEWCVSCLQGHIRQYVASSPGFPSLHRSFGR